MRALYVRWAPTFRPVSSWCVSCPDISWRTFCQCLLCGSRIPRRNRRDRWCDERWSRSLLTVEYRTDFRRKYQMRGVLKLTWMFSSRFFHWQKRVNFSLQRNMISFYKYREKPINICNLNWTIYVCTLYMERNCVNYSCCLINSIDTLVTQAALT